jgi:hypothetical protein
MRRLAALAPYLALAGGCGGSDEEADQPRSLRVD